MPTEIMGDNGMIEKSVTGTWGNLRMKYEKARAEIIDFGEGNSFSMCTSGQNYSGGGYNNIGEFFTQNITGHSGAFYPVGGYPPTQFFCEFFTQTGDHYVTVKGRTVIISISPYEGNIYNCSNYCSFGDLG